MKARIPVLAAAALLVFTGTLLSQTVNFRFSNYFYGWQRIDSLSESSSAKTTHIRGYQNYLFDYSQDKVGFSLLAQTEEDIIHKVGRGFHYRIYNAYFKANNILDRLDIKLGRQNIFAGTGRGTLDGLYLKLKAGMYKEYQLAVYGGALAPYTYDIDKYPELKKNYMFGAQFTYYGVKDLMTALSYTNKKRAPVSYTTTRMDSLYNIMTHYVELDGPAQQLLGLDFNYLYNGKYNFYGKAYYDVTMKKFYKGEFNVRANLPDNFRVFAGYTYREPQFSYNSIFWVFNYSKNQEIEAGADYTLKNGINIFARAGFLIYDNKSNSAQTVTQVGFEKPTNKSLKIQAGFTHANYGLSFIRYMGYAGESDGVTGYYQRPLYKEMISASASASYSRYRLGNYDTDKVNSFSGMLGFTYRPIPQFSVDAQGQFLINRIYKTDARFLVGFSFWLFKNFNRSSQ